MLRVDHLKLPGVPPLSFSVAAGECLAIVGPSGSGKTRLLRALADLDPAEGHIFLEGAERREVPATEWRRQLRYVAAEPAWWGPTPRSHFPSGAGVEERIGRLLASLDLAPEKLDQSIATLSTGERQRLAFIRAMIDAPKLLLLDEPTASLDAVSAALVERLILTLTEAGRAIVLVSHDPAQIDRLSHARIILGKSDRVAATAPGAAS